MCLCSWSAPARTLTIVWILQSPISWVLLRRKRVPAAVAGDSFRGAEAGRGTDAAAGGDRRQIPDGPQSVPGGGRRRLGASQRRRPQTYTDIYAPGPARTRPRPRSRRPRSRRCRRSSGSPTSTASRCGRFAAARISATARRRRARRARSCSTSAGCAGSSRSIPSSAICVVEPGVGFFDLYEHLQREKCR